MRFYSRVAIAFTHRASSRPASSHENNTGVLPVSIVYIVRTSNGSETPSASSPFLGPPGARLSAFLRSRCARTQGWSEFACCAGRIQKVRVCHSLSAFLRSQTNSECPSMSLHLAVICSLPVKSKVTWIPLHQRRIQSDPVCQNYSIVVCSPTAKSKFVCSLFAFGEIKEYLNSPASQTNSEKLWYVTCIWL